MVLALGCGSPPGGRVDDAAPGDAPEDGARDGTPDGTPDGATPSCLTSGMLDASFGSGGVTTFRGLVPNEVFGLGSVKIDAESRIVATGSFLQGARSCVLVRLLPDGSLDPSFGSGGIVRQSFGSANGECWYFDAALQADGKIVVVGLLDPHTSTRGIVVRYLPDGALDLAFGQDGLVVSSPEPTSDFTAVAVDAQQRIVVAGMLTSGPIFEEVSTYLTRRYLPDGSPDPAFGVDGTAEEPFRNGSDAAFDLAIQASGRILVVGEASTSPNTAIGHQLAIVGYTPDGSKDPTFGANGLVFVDGAGAGIARDAQDRIVAVGMNFLLEEAVVPVLREDGTVEATIVDPQVPSGYTSVEFDASGRYVAVGTTGAARPVLARYTAGGRDLTFGTNGVAADLPLPGTLQEGHDLAIQADGRIVIVGDYGFGDRGDGYVARYCP
ncbi:MAG: hypothetical protein KF773_34810 [Deltaproteobacteria bacterium]|nr:hypothetical protein [Deltaproteobacteria bacterium]